MESVFYVAGAIAVFATFMMLTRLNAVHALLYLVVSLLAVAVVFFDLGAPFIGTLEIIIYAGAIMVLFVFVMMMLNLGERSIATERALVKPGMWVGPAVLAAVLFVELVSVLVRGTASGYQPSAMGPKEVSAALFGPYLIGVELASFLLMSGLVGAYHLGWRGGEKFEELKHGKDSPATRAASSRDSVLVGSGRSVGPS